jgi:hypothetical protein
MPLQSSGQISFADINTELGRTSDAQIGLNEAESGTYAPLNPNSPNRPNGSTPNSINEWWGYDHYIPPLTVYTGCGRSNTITGVCDDSTNANRIFYSDCGPFDFGVNCFVYIDTSATPLQGYDYVYINSFTWQINNSTGRIIAFAEDQPC